MLLHWQQRIKLIIRSAVPPFGDAALLVILRMLPCIDQDIMAAMIENRSGYVPAKSVRHCTDSFVRDEAHRGGSDFHH